MKKLELQQAAIKKLESDSTLTHTEYTLLNLVKDLYAQIEELTSELEQRPTYNALEEKESLSSLQDYDY